MLASLKVAGAACLPGMQASVNQSQTRLAAEGRLVRHGPQRKLVERVAEAHLPTTRGDFRLIGYRATLTMAARTSGEAALRRCWR